MVYDSFDAPGAPKFYERRGTESRDLRRDQYSERQLQITKIRVVISIFRLGPQNLCVVDKDVGVHYPKTAEAGLVASDGNGDGFCLKWF